MEISTTSTYFQNRNDGKWEDYDVRNEIIKAIFYLQKLLQVKMKYENL